MNGMDNSFDTHRMSSECKGRILVIDDDEAILETLEDALSIDGFEVTTTDRGASAVEAARQGGFNLAITDLKMPGMSGLETLAALRDVQPSLPVIVMTGFASGGTTSECTKLGAFGLLRKPFKLEELLRVIRHALEV
jgi:DNA-binding NtrC family response regulator